MISPQIFVKVSENRGNRVPLGLARRTEAPNPKEEKHRGRPTTRSASNSARVPRRGATRSRAERLQKIEIGYLYHDSFDAVHGEKILRPPEVDPAVSRARRAPTGADFYMSRLYEVPLLSQEEETHLFRKMNYLKFRADRLRQQLDPRRAKVSQLDEIERLLAEAQAVRNQIIEANLRLVFALAKRYASVGSAAFDEFVGEGHVTLMRAVEKFDFSRGVRFSTYATWALVNGSNALLKKQNPANRLTFGMSIDGVEDYVTDYRTSAADEDALQELRHQVEQLLVGLNSRERAIIEARFGFNPTHAPTLKQVGQDLGVSKERVRQLQQRALRKLRVLAECRQVELPGE